MHNSFINFFLINKEQVQIQRKLINMRSSEDEDNRLLAVDWSEMDARKTTDFKFYFKYYYV